MTKKQKTIINRRLSEYYTPYQARLWWTGPHPLLNGKTAKDCSFEEVSRLLDQLDSGAYV